MRAQWVLALCREFHVLPSQIMDEPVEFLQMLKLESLGKPDGERSG